MDTGRIVITEKEAGQLLARLDKIRARTRPDGKVQEQVRLASLLINKARRRSRRMNNKKTHA